MKHQRIPIFLLIGSIALLIPPTFASEEEWEDREAKEFLAEMWPRTETFFASEFPPILVHLELLNSREPEEAFDLKFELAEIYEEYLFLREEHPEMADRFLDSHKMEFQSHQLAGQIQRLKIQESRNAGTQEEIVAMEQRLKLLLTRSFEVRLQFKKQELRQLEMELEELSSNLQLREQMKDEIIHRRFLELTSGDDVFGW